MKKDLTKEQLYEGVKSLVECASPHIILNQPKLFSLFSLGFQYLLFAALKNPGHYIIRIEDAALADKLLKKAKDEMTRKVFSKLMLPRRFKYENSILYLDFFSVGTWNITKDIPAHKLKGALIVKNTSEKAMDDMMTLSDAGPDLSLPANFYLTSILDICPKTIFIAYKFKNDQLTPVQFPFLAQESDEDETLPGVMLAKNLKFED